MFIIQRAHLLITQKKLNSEKSLAPKSNFYYVKNSQKPRTLVRGNS
ncbi:MAG: hypothetical protein AABW90_03130 [Nanoarchaeota archaeon]